MIGKSKTYYGVCLHIATWIFELMKYFIFFTLHFRFVLFLWH